MEKVRIKYETRLKAWLVNIEKIHAEIKQHRQELEQSKQELEQTNQKLTDILNKISSQDVKNNERIRNMVIEAKALFYKYGKEINPHIDELFTLVP